MYRPIKGVKITGKNRPSVSIVTPVYNEDPVLFEKALQSWIANGVDEIIAVIDKSNVRHIVNFERNYIRKKHGSTKLRMIVTPKPGKRAALADGISRAKGDIIALVDSDTVWDGQVIAKSLPYFTNPAIGAVTVAQRISNPDTISNVLFDMLLWNRYAEEVPFLLGMGNAFNTLSGRTAIYRREALLNDKHDNMHHLRHEFFLGTRGVSGDDKRLTHLILEQGWHIAYAKGATVYTQGLGNARTFLKQRLRWTRNGWRASLRAVKDGWIFKHPALAYFVIDGFLQPFFMLLGPIAFVVACLSKEWLVASILVAWWVASRLIKLFGYFRAHPKRIIYLPSYILYTYTNALLKIYALGTLVEHSWATRGHKKRKGVVRKAAIMGLGVGITAFVLFLLSDFVVAIQRESAIQVPKPKPVAASTFKLSDADAAVIQAGQHAPVTPVSPTSVKQYVVKPGDTLSAISAKTCLSVQELKKINNIQSVNRISVGQTFFYYCPSVESGETE
jgi:hyaluronan synthase